MKTSQGGRARTTAFAAFCLMLPLWLGSCMPLPGSPGSAGPGQAPAAAPAPQPAPAPSPSEAAAAPDLPPAALPVPEPGRISGAEPGSGSGTGSGIAAVPPHGYAPASPPAAEGPAGQVPDRPANGPAVRELPAAGTPASPAPEAAPGSGPESSGGFAAGPVDSAVGTAVYYVALDDGGSSGVRFGCNDSLVAVHTADPSIREPLQAAMSQLLSEGRTPTPVGLYSALDSSALQYVSGYFDGATVVVNLTGSMQPGGVCDIPRIEAQLTHTAVTAVGAIRAEIYVDGVRLADVLSLR